MNPELEKRISVIAADRESGASEILAAVIAVLRDAAAQGADLDEVGAALRDAQPSMAGVWNAVAAARAGSLDRFAHRVARATASIARFALDVLETGLEPNAPLRCVTLSYSGVVAHVLEAVARRRPLRVACTEGHPALEGRRLATRLAAAGATVSHYEDAAIAQAIAGADAVIVGADAVAATWFINKCGTKMLAATATFDGVPTYVLAGREKFLDEEGAARLSLRSGPPAEVWSAAPVGVVIENPYFERVPLRLVTAVISDAGIRPARPASAL